MTREIIYYYLPGVPRKNSSTGEIMVKELGPYAVGILGSFWRTPDREEVKAYVKRMHGVEPSRMEVHLNGKGLS